MYQHRVKTSAGPARPPAINGTAYQSPTWEGVKAFGRQAWEPFSGALNYWTGGRAGSDFKDDSMWVDANRRLYNALPGRNQLPLTYQNNGMLDTAAGALGASGLAAAGAGAALAAPVVLPAARAFMGAGQAARGITSIPGVAGQLARYLPQALLPTAPFVAEEVIKGGLKARDELNAQQQRAQQAFLAGGASPEEAQRLAYKGSWGTMWHGLKDYAMNPYHYIYRQGGSNPLDQTFVDAMGSPMPADAFTAVRQTGNVLGAGYLAPLEALAYAGINKVEGIPRAMQQVYGRMQSMAPMAMQGWRADGMQRLLEAQRMAEQSRIFNAMRNYYGADAPMMAQYLARPLAPQAEIAGIRSLTPPPPPATGAPRIIAATN